MQNSRTAGIIIIGNEILSGKVHDINSFFLAKELRALGVDLRRISVIPDELDAIGKEAVEFSKNYDYVFTSGGVGPTHDDITMAGIARGFNVRLVQRPEIKAVLFSRYGDSVNSSVMKMTEVPEGSEVIFREDMRFPLICYRNIYIFPGIPEYVQSKFPKIKEKFRSSTYYLKKLFLNSHESHIAEILNAVVAGNRDVVFGSYPATGRPDYRVLITAESKSEGLLQKAVDDLIMRLPADIIVRVE